MAKIIDFKTKQVLADIPVEFTMPRFVKKYHVNDAARKILSGNVSIISRSEAHAMGILANMLKTVKHVKKSA